MKEKAIRPLNVLSTIIYHSDRNLPLYCSISYFLPPLIRCTMYMFFFLSMSRRWSNPIQLQMYFWRCYSESILRAHNLWIAPIFLNCCLVICISKQQLRNWKEFFWPPVTSRHNVCIVKSVVKIELERNPWNLMWDYVARWFRSTYDSITCER